jgi:hypothetical protein
MSAPSQEDLDKLRSSNETLREQITDAQTAQREHEVERAREIEYTQLQAEETRLKAQLAAVKEASKVGNVKAGTDALLQQAKNQLAAAQALAEQPVGPVDTTEGKPVNVSDNGAENPLVAEADDKTETDKNGGNS